MVAGLVVERLGVDAIPPVDRRDENSARRLQLADHLPEIVSAVNGQVEIILDGGVRRGSDVVKALCLGARAVLVGRAYAYGLAAAGTDGVARALEILRTDLDRTLRLLGCSSIAALDPSYVDAPSQWFARCK